MSNYRRQLSAAEIRSGGRPQPPTADIKAGARPQPSFGVPPPPAPPPAAAAAPIEDILRPPPAAVRFAYDGANATEAAVLHGLAAAYEWLFLLEKGRQVNGKPCYRHVERRDKWIAFSGAAWMAQGESALGSDRGVMMLRDRFCETPGQCCTCKSE